MTLHETSLFAIKIIDFPVFDKSVTRGPTDGRTDCGPRTIEEVEAFPAQDETLDESEIDISASNETMQNVLGSIVKLQRIFQKKFWG